MTKQEKDLYILLRKVFCNLFLNRIKIENLFT